MVPSLPDVPKTSNDLKPVELQLGDAPVVDRRALWFAFFGAPAAWTIDELFALAFHTDACDYFRAEHFTGLPSVPIALVIAGLLMLATAAAAGYTGLRIYRHVGEEPTDTIYGPGGNVRDRVRFMALGAMIFSGLFLFGILLRFITVFFIRPCI
jgi:hypothetical protein